MAGQHVANRCLSLLLDTGRWSRAELAAASGVPLDLLTQFADGQRPLSRGVFEAIVSSLHVTFDDLKAIYAALPRANPWKAGRSQAEAFAEEQAVFARCSKALGESVTRNLLEQGHLDLDYPGVVALRSTIREVRASWGRVLVEILILVSDGWERLLRPREEDRGRGAALWARLEGFTAEERRFLVKLGSEFQHWSLCVHLAEHSAVVARRDVGEALELSELALEVFRHVEGPAAWLGRLEAYVLALAANARRLGGDRAACEEALERVRLLREQGESSAPELLAEYPFLDLEAALAQGRGDAPGPEDAEVAREGPRQRDRSGGRRWPRRVTDR